jgi:hypothetical protein
MEIMEIISGDYRQSAGLTSVPVPGVLPLKKTTKKVERGSN